MPHPPKSILVRLIASLALLPALAACGNGQPAAPLPASDQALKAVIARPGADRQILARAVDRLFTDKNLGETRAVVVMHGGAIVAERYADDYGPQTRFLGWSMAKTVTAVAVGMLVADGRLRLDDSPPIPRWQRPGDPRGGITLTQLLQMRSGLRHEERSDPEYDGSTVRMMFREGRDDMAGWAEAQPLEAQPGRVFEYSTATGVILADIIARTLTRSTDPVERRAVVADFLHNQLFEPAGLHSMTVEFDRAGTMIGGSMIHATARDWARFGEFLRHGGSVRGAQIVPRRWIEFMRRPSPRARDYGAQLWLNRDSRTDRKILFAGSGAGGGAARGPESLFGAVGHGGQYLLVSPDQQLTVVRMGETADEARPALADALADIVTLYPGA